jgi:cyclohexa-1,5-dienecarbonyl-CoA hydratase
MNLSRAKLQMSHHAQIATVILSAPKANILDRAMLGDIVSILSGLTSSPNLKVIVITGEGSNFSCGASVSEHLPGEIEQTLSELRRLLLAVAKAPAPTIAAVRGYCLGGGLELALACDLIAAEETAQFGCPEIKLAVFPPAASVLLPVKAGSSLASKIVLTGGTYCGKDLFAAGLVSLLAKSGALDDELIRWLESDFLPRSAQALGHAAAATRLPMLRALEEDLPVLEKLYLERLMQEPDPTEGIQAFLEKREPHWASVASAGRARLD